VSTLGIRQGKTLRRRWIWCNPIPGSDPLRADRNNPIDITGYSARLEIKIHRELGDDIPLLSLTDAPGGGLTITGAEGTIALVVPKEVTAGFDFSSAVWDLEIEAPDGTVIDMDSGAAQFKR